MANQFRTFILLAALTVFLVLVGYWIGGRQGMLIAFIFAAGMNFFSYWFSDKMVLRMYKAQPINENQLPEIYGLIKELTQTAGMPMPTLYLIHQRAPNAFATGRNPQNAVVAVTTGLLDMLHLDEVKGVLAHELAHVKNRDILIQTIAATMAGAITMLATMARFSAFFGGHRRDGEGGGGILGVILVSILAPLAAMLIQMAISRSREYLADATGARIAGDSEGLASALEQLGRASGRIPLEASPATAHMFIVNPLVGIRFKNLFTTHPPIGERVARLRGLDSPDDPSPNAHHRSRPQNMEDAGRSFWDQMK